MRISSKMSALGLVIIILGSATAASAKTDAPAGGNAPGLLESIPVMPLYSWDIPIQRPEFPLLDYKPTNPPTSAKSGVSGVQKTKPASPPAPKPEAVPKKAVTAPKPAPQKQGILSRVVRGATSLASRAGSWIGTRYVWGGVSSRGVDCSGLTSLLYKTLGVKLPHSAGKQYKMGQSVSRKELAPGDLVFFNTTGSVSHVGVYIGDNKFVHAANRRRGVRTDSLGSAYYNKRYIGARRYI